MAKSDIPSGAELPNNEPLVGRLFRSPLLIVLTLLSTVAGAFRIAGVSSMLLATIILAAGIWLFITAEVWCSKWIKKTGRYAGSIVLLTSCLSGGAAVWVKTIISEKGLQAETASESTTRTLANGSPVEFAIALIPTIHRMRDKDGGYMKGGQNDLIAVLRASQHNGTAIRHVRSVRIVGDVSADCALYTSAFHEDLHGQYTTGELEQECAKRQPFLHLSWISFPLDQTRIDTNDEEFIRFKISSSLGAVTLGGDPKDYFGFGDTGSRPKYPMTSPVWSLLMRFSRTNPAELTGYAPIIRDELKFGKVRLQVQLDDEITEIATQDIKIPWRVSLPESNAARMLPQELFYGIDNGERTTLPTANDPLVSSTEPRQLKLIFKNSALFTPQRKESIASEMETLYRYLASVGFDLPKEMPPIGTRAGNVITMSWIIPLDSIYEAQISIPEKWLDNADDVRNVYALWVFRQLFGTLQLSDERQFMEPMASLFSCYYRSSLAGRNLCDHDWIGRNWNNKLWKIRSRKGKEFTDSIVFYTYKAWRPSSKDSKSFDDFFGLHFLPAVWIKDNGGQDLKDIGDILNDQQAAYNATPQAAPGQSAASPLTVVRLEKVSTDPDAPHEFELVIATTKNLPDLATFGNN